MKRRALPTLLVLALAAGASRAAGQDTTMIVAGIVVDSLTGQPVVSVEVYVAGEIATLTDQGGRFRLRVARHQPFIILRRIGYRRRTVSVQLGETRPRVDIGTVWFAPMYFALDTLQVEADLVRDHPALTAFYQRRRSGLGQYITAQQIWKRNPTMASELLRSIAGVTLRCGTGSCTPMTSRGGRWCPMKVMLDGMPTSAAQLDLIPPNWIAGIEVYRSPTFTPIELGSSNCGTVAVWTGGER